MVKVLSHFSPFASALAVVEVREPPSILISPVSHSTASPVAFMFNVPPSRLK
ncbi:MAG: hypothetical protein BWY67_02160 [Bacteroidetes bacterium ADurb.Bin397]|nr:MAG: hypothetical protein BWY67_02160 [Bacteroidetes bacterium ADurb.Bin397]